MPLEVGDLIQGKYRIIRVIGQGGMGTVFEGQNVGIARRVAIKILHNSLLNNDGTVDRFEREAQAAGRIGNDHILEVLDKGQLDSGERFMVMEFLDGESLEQRLDRLGRVTPIEAYFLVRQLLLGLGAAHDTGIIHRDLKPDNVFIVREKAGQPDYVKIIDFGISKFVNAGADLRMTATGAVMGTPYYMSPEQARGSRDADARSDIYAVGVILFRIVSGAVPFDAASFNELLFKIVLGETPRLSGLLPDIDPIFDELVLRSMARDPAERFQTTGLMVQAFDEWYTAVAPSVQPRSGPPLPSGNRLLPSDSRRNLRATPASDHFAHTQPAPDGKLNASWDSQGLEVRAPLHAVPRPNRMWLGIGAGVVLVALGTMLWFGTSNPTPQPTVSATASASVQPATAAQNPVSSAATLPNAPAAIASADLPASSSASANLQAAPSVAPQQATGNKRPGPARPAAVRPRDPVRPSEPNAQKNGALIIDY